MDTFQSALGLVLGRLEEMRDGGGRWPRASRKALAHFMAGGAGPASDRAEVVETAAATRTYAVSGIGDLEADLMFIGEMPGTEGEESAPFAGPAGVLLRKLIGAMGFSLEQVYIATMMRARSETTGRSRPSSAELKDCGPLLLEQIRLVRPKVLVVLGATATEALLDLRGPMHKLRGQWHTLEGRPLMVTFDPSYLIAQDSNIEKRKVWEDMLQVLEKLGRPITEKQRRHFASVAAN